ncbi:MAG: hypothetical protein OXB86_03900 [Bdellovibrionales bacterium]|nr:hypothetical protein [Bdellovibrionales bacterium]
MPKLTWILFLKISLFIHLSSFSYLLFSMPSVEMKTQDILHAPNLKKLQAYMKKHKTLSFQKTLCEKQLQLKVIPYACYFFPELKPVADTHCQELGINNVTLSSLKKALSTPLPKSCRKILKAFEKILIYRKKDLLLKPFHL